MPTLTGLDVFYRSSAPNKLGGRSLTASLYTKLLGEDPTKPYVLFVHGGPGSNSFVFEKLVAIDGCCDRLGANLIVYDQRNCGRSTGFPEPVTHLDNVRDLLDLIKNLRDERGLDLRAIIGHSYGAKLASDVARVESDLAYVFIATHVDLLRPRLNNLLLDLKFLQRHDRLAYEAALARLDPGNLDSIWDLTTELAPIFGTNPDRKSFYWANIEVMERVAAIEATSPYPAASATFTSVRRDIYSVRAAQLLDLGRPELRSRWIVGFHDLVMDGNDPTLPELGAIIFPRSGHYPHFEENERFCEVVNALLAT